MSRMRAASATLVLVITATMGGAPPVAAVDPTSDLPGSPDPRNSAPPGEDGFAAGTTSFDSAVIDNGLFQLGINPEGHMNVPNAGTPSAGSGTTTVGLRYVPENNEVLAPGCLCEGWGVADRTAGVSGWASGDYGVSSNLTVLDFQAGELSPGVAIARSTVEIGGVFEVRHDFSPSQYTPNLYEILVTIENLSAQPVDLVYRRKMDWDVEPTHFNEYVTVAGESDFLLYSSNDGFADPDPLSPPTSIGGITGTFEDAGPDDHGALFDFAFGSLGPGATRQFQIFYGAAPDEDTADFAVNQVNADVWSYGQANISDGPDADTLLDGKEQGKPNTFIFAFASPDQCDEQSLSGSLSPTPGGRVSMSYDPRFAAPDADPRQEEWARRIAEAMQDRADRTLNEYEALGFQIDDSTIEIRIECNNITGRNAFVESSSLVHFRSHAVRSWFASDILAAKVINAIGLPLPDRGFLLDSSPREEWVNVLDHELAHTSQYLETVPEVPFAHQLAFWINYFENNQTVVESSAVLAQDLLSDADDLDPIGDGFDPIPHSYMLFTRQFMAAPDGLSVLDGSEYRKAAIFQYWAERWGQAGLTDLEERAARFARDLVTPLRTGTAAMADALGQCGGACPDLVRAVKEFYVAAYAHQAPNVTSDANAAFEFLDSHFDRNGTAGGGQQYPEIVATSEMLNSGDLLVLSDQPIGSTEGRVYEIALGPNVSEVQARLDLQDALIGPSLSWALVPFDPDGNAQFENALLAPDPSQLQTVEVTAGGRLGVVVVATEPALWDSDAVFDLRLDAPAIISGSGSAASDTGDGSGVEALAALSSSEGILLLATPQDERLVTIDVYASDLEAPITLRRLAESGAEVTLGTYTGVASFDDGPLDTGRYIYEATADISGQPVVVYSHIVEVADDVTPPHAWMELAGRAAETNHPALRVFIGGLSESVTDMRFAFSEADLESAAWVPFEAFSQVELASGDGVYQVFAQVRDPAGLPSEVLVGEVVLDTASPDSTAGPLPSTTSTADLSVPYNATDAATFVQYVEIWLRHRADSSSDWTLWTMAGTASGSPAEISLPFGEGEYELYTAAVDGAGNREEPPPSADATTLFSSAPPTIPGTMRVSVSSAGAEGTGASGGSKPSSISDDGRYVAFVSDASNLVAGDTNGASDVFVHDRQTGETGRVSVASDGSQANALSASPAISGDGRFVSFASTASNLVTGDTNGKADVFVHDRQTGATTRVSVASSGAQANGASGSSSLSDDGRYLTFASSASNLVSGDTNKKEDIFVHDRQTGATTRVSVTSAGAQAGGHSADPAISDDGRYVAFASDAKDLVANDGNRKADIFVHDRETGATTRVSLLSSGQEANAGSEQPAISGDGRYVAFVSFATNLVPNDTNQAGDVFVHDRQTGETTRISVTPEGGNPDDRAFNPSISDDGRYVGFASKATNLVAGSPSNLYDAYVRDRQEAVTVRVSIADDGSRGNSHSGQGSVEVSGNGRHVVFDSVASNLVPDDTNGVSDVFVRADFGGG